MSQWNEAPLVKEAQINNGGCRGTEAKIQIIMNIEIIKVVLEGVG